MQTSLVLVLIAVICCASAITPKLVPGMTWQYTLQGKVNTNPKVQFISIDLFDNTKETIAALKKNGVFVACYINVGSHENWRPDAKTFPKAVIGNKMDGWDEHWLDIRNIAAFEKIYTARFNLAKAKGCDGIDADNVDSYSHKNTGFPITMNDQIKFNKWFANLAHSKGLKIGLKNALEILPQLVNDFDFSINEQCFEYNECKTLLPFIKLNKPVFNVEYNVASKVFCPKAKAMKMSSMKKALDLKALPFEPCNTTPVTAMSDENAVSMSDSNLFALMYAMSHSDM